ncbi:MAG TPA: ABC transporter permease [Alphaproteobacteria bacterium]|nr:ABC transporter permease [Alphaproteobacteria bacterium]
MKAFIDRLAPYILGLIALALWEGLTRLNAVPVYVLPGPLLIAKTLWQDGASLLGSLWFTLKITALALAAATLGGVLLAVVMAQSRILERSLLPYAVIAQVTPVVAIAPLIIIWADNTTLALVICAWIVAFFPITAATMTGLNAADHNLRDLFRIYGASRWQSLRLLRAPAALPYFLTGLRVSGGLSLVGAVVAEFVAGTGGAETGLAFRILESGYRLQIPRLFAALTLLAAAGIVIYLALDLLSKLLLRRWHETHQRH